MCPQCDVSLVLHRAEGACRLPPLRPPRARCPTRCRDCGSVVGRPPRRRAPSGSSTSSRGARRRRFPVFRLDADAAAGKGRVATMLRALRARPPAGVLVGTQMVAKGHDFPDVDARRRARRRRDAALPRLPGRGAHLRARHPARRARAAAAARRRPRCSCRRSPRRRARSRSPPRHDADGLPRRRAGAARGAALPAVRDADPDRVLGARAAADGARRGRAPCATASTRRAPRVLGPAPLFRCAGASAQPARGQGAASARRRSPRSARRSRRSAAARGPRGVSAQRRRRPAVSSPASSTRLEAHGRGQPHETELEEHPETSSRRTRSARELDPEVARARATRRWRTSASSATRCCGPRPARSTASTTRCARRSSGWAS